MQLNDKWNIGDMAADYIFCANKNIDFALPGTLRSLIIIIHGNNHADKEKCFPIFDEQKYLDDTIIKSQSSSIL